MSKSKLSAKSTRRRYTKEYKQESLNLAERVGVAKAANQLDVAESQLSITGEQKRAGS